MRSSNRARGAKSWKPLDLTKIDDTEFEPPTTTSASSGLEHREQSSGQAEFERTGGDTLLQAAQVWPSSSLLPGTGSSYPESNCHYNPADQHRQSQSLTSKLPISFTQSSTYGNNPGPANFQLSMLHNRNEVFKVFGNSLPGPDFLQHTTGSQEGQVQFIQHPNGDVSAHQWTASLYQWTNLGQYSNTRKRIEGQLASDRIRGQSSSMLSQLDSVAYFRAVALQREPRSESKTPLGSYRDHDFAQSVLDDPKFLGARQGPHPGPQLQTRPNPQNFTTRNVSNENSYLGKSSLFTSPTASPKPYQALNNTHAWSTSKSVSKMSDAYQTGEYEAEATSRGSGLSRTQSIPSHDNVTVDPFRRHMSVAASSFHPAVPNKGLEDVFTVPQGAPTTGQPYHSLTLQGTSTNVHRAEESTSERPKPDLKVCLPYSNERHFDAPMNLGRYSRMNHSSPELQRSPKHDPERPIMRTVLHDPLRTSEQPHTSQFDHQHVPIPANTANKMREMEGLRGGQTSGQTFSPASTDFRNHLGVSDPDEERPPRPIYHPIYTADVFDDEPQPSREKKLNDWWDSRDPRSGKMRFEENFRPTARNPTNPYPPRNDPDNPVANGLLSALYDTIVSYAKGSHAGHDYLNRFGEPPEWCVDKTNTGSRSFFGEDWGAPPSRVGRDPRYRPIVPDVRYTRYEETERRAGYDGRFRFGGPPPF
ncbi:MAG: hypothetical protein Q9165_008009 [Trypethelium subeluteriae]